jgi:hypothetical protein
MGKCKRNPEEFAKLLFDEIIELENRDRSIMKAVQEGDYTQADKEIIQTLRPDHIRRESFYLWIFLTTYCIDEELCGIGDKLTELVHDSLYTLIGQNIAECNDQNVLNHRLVQYSDALKEDIECIGLEDHIFFKKLTTLFFENLLERKLASAEFGKPRILLGFFVVEIMDLLKKTIQKLKADTIISFDK